MFEDMVKTGLVAGDAGVDLVRSVFSSLDDKFRIRQEGRAMETMSASPPARMRSATSGVLMRLVVISGTLRCFLSSAVTQLKAPRGTLVAMVGMRASCQPMPVLMR